MVVATTKAEAALGEYQFLFTIGEYLGEDSARAAALFERRHWKHLYAIDSATAIAPFSLADIVSSAGNAAQRSSIGTRGRPSTTGSSGRSSRRTRVSGARLSSAARSRLGRPMPRLRPTRPRRPRSESRSYRWLK
jgi:hypothetical protein